MVDCTAQGAKKVRSLILGLRQESLIAQIFGCVVGALIFLGFLMERLQHRTTSPNDHSGIMGCMLFMFLAFSHSFLATRIAKVAEALAEMHDPSASPVSVGGAAEKADADEFL